MASDDDRTAPIGRDEIKEIVTRADSPLHKADLVTRILRCLSERRDAYNGVISSLIYMIDTNDDNLIQLLQHNLQQNVAVHPMRYGGKIFITKCLPRLILEKPQFVANFFEDLVVDLHRDHEKRINNPSELLKMKIIALRAISQAEQSACEKLTDITTQQIEAICDESIIKGDNQTKLDTLYIILDTKISTKVITDRELDIYLKFYKGALDLQEPGLRQKFLAITSKLLKRMKDSKRVVWRDRERFSDSERDEITRRYMKFLEWLIKFCLDNTYSNKYFGSFLITTTTLSNVIEHITLDDPNLPVAPFFHVKRFHDTILSCLVLDTFEDNKKLALKLLLALRHHEQIIHDQSSGSLEQIAYQLVNSVNPAHSLTCQYVFKLVIGYEKISLKEHKNRLIFRHLDKLVRLVESGIRATKDDFFLGLKQNAIYPKLTCIRTLLDEIDIKDLEDDKDGWRGLAERLVTASIEACESVSSIVCNMNPETIGHLPMDQKPIDINALSKNLDKSVRISDAHINTVTSQHLLITGWKTIKECSLSMGALCTRLWWPKRANLGEPILEPKHIRSIIEFFKHYLRNLRHRGAFEQTYNGFIMVTKKIWLDDGYKSLLVDNLTELLNEFKREQSVMDDQKVEYLKKQITRRSAGLPFLVQAIAISEHKHDSTTLRFIMDTLISITESGKAEQYQMIHCLNILKALINDFNLADKVTPYLGRILIITIEAFKSEDFSIRNCANMLMRVLVDRTFGASRLRDEIHRRNTLSYEKFFSTYPDLHAKLVQYLRDGLGDRKCLAPVHAVFIILAHLRPSINASEDYSIDKMVGPYIDPILELALTCPDFKLRGLSAKMLVQLETQLRSELSYADFKLFDDYQSLIASQDWPKQIKTESNRLHGLLCMLRYWMEHWTSITSIKHQVQLSHLVDTMIRIISEIGAHDRTNFLRISAIDLCESACLVGQVSDTMLHYNWLPAELSSDQVVVTFSGNPMASIENLAFRSISISLTISNYSSNLGRPRDVLKSMIELIRRPPDRIYSVNMQASLIRFLRQFFSRGEDFIDKLVSNFDLDSIAAHMTPIDKLNQRSELDLERELWLNYCDQPVLRQLIRNEIPNDCLDHMFMLAEYEEFRPCQDKSLIRANSPRTIELLAFVCKAWDHFELERRCIWLRKGETVTDKLTFLTNLIRNLPDCDIKCLALLCASRLFTSHLHWIHANSERAQEDLEPAEIRNGLLVAKEFSSLLEELAGNQHDRNIRAASCEIVNNIQGLVIACWCEPLKEVSMNIFSAIIKLCQDEEHEIRESISSGLVSLFTKDTPTCDMSSANGSHLDKLISFILEKLLDPSNDQDVLRCYEFSARIIFNHSKNSSIDLGQERESLFDKTRPNVFADQVTIIQNTLTAAKTFLGKTSGPVKLDDLTFYPDVVEELTTSDVKVDHDVGDYSWRFKNEPNVEVSEFERGGGNKMIVDQALTDVRQSLDYFSYSNMLTDTSFGFHESSLFRRLAFVKLLHMGTDYQNKQIVAEIKHKLNHIIDAACATTILSKCYELLEQDMVGL